MSTVLYDVGRIQVFGPNADRWSDEEGRLIGGTRAVFDSDVSVPEPRFLRGNIFTLPCQRSQVDYKIHLLENGTAVIIKDEKLFLCTHVDSKPRVVTFHPVSNDNMVAKRL